MTPPYTLDRSGMYFSKIIVSISTERGLKQQESNAAATANKSARFLGGPTYLGRAIYSSVGTAGPARKKRLFVRYREEIYKVSGKGPPRR